MSSRERILAAIRKIGLDAKPLPEKGYWTQSGDLITAFAEVIIRIGGSFIRAKSHEAAIEEANRLAQSENQVFNAFDEAQSLKIRPHEWDSLDMAIIAGDISVAENGAIWVSESNIPDRVIPFICKQLVVVMHADKLVSTMHEAYQLIEQQDYGYGVFISGPSKTADIEQALVIGAHGPLAMTVIMVGA